MFAERFIEMGFPAGFAEAYIAMLATTRSGPARVTHDVEKVLGRPAASFADGVSVHSDILVCADEYEPARRGHERH